MNKTSAFLVVAVALACFVLAGDGPAGHGPAQTPAPSQDEAAAGLIPAFPIERSAIGLGRPARAQNPFDKLGRRFAVLGFESGSFEAWAYPLKLVRNVSFSFLLGSSTLPIEGREIVRWVHVEPAATSLTFAYQSFTVKAHFVTSVNEPGAVILLEVDAVEPLTVVCSFLPVLQPMWPAGLGGQYAYWDSDFKAYLLSEPTRTNHSFIGSPAAQGISYTPAHMLSDVPNQFKIELGDPRSAAGKFIPIVLAGGKGGREDVRAVYARLSADPRAVYRDALEHYRKLLEGTLRIRTPIRDLNLALEWAKVAYDNLLVDNPDLGRGLVAGLGVSGTSGRPGFGWFFGTDAYLNSLSLNSLGATEISRDALAFTQKWQRKDGKMAHELTQAAGYLDWWKDYPYGYIHGDTSPYYIVAVHDYFLHTGDMEFLKASWPSVVRAYSWSEGTDENEDGLMDNARAGLGALEFGSLTGIQTDVYLAAVWTKACLAMRDLAGAMGDKRVEEAAQADAEKARLAFDSRFWDGPNGQYSYAFTNDGRLVPEITPWSAVACFWDLGPPERSVQTLSRIASADLVSDWGVRMLSTRSALYEPLNYNYGAAWPFLTGWVSAALFRHGFIQAGYATLLATARHTFDNSLGSVTELYSGAQNIWPAEAVSHQGFSTGGVVLPLVRGLFGLEGDAARRTVRFAPRFPANWANVRAQGFRVGGRAFTFSFERETGRLRIIVSSEPGGGFRLEFAPLLGPGTRVIGATVNTKPVTWSDEAG
ncbi:MAG: GH116 family glycosyl hydrolase, partial [Candidatus Aminicenantes bacterium]|nr:GH116 family glycosyl hydrolase [Candidatus Aminicenantes bacterium]